MENTSHDILAVGSVALDSIETPFGKVTDAVGGSAIHFAASSSFFTRVGIVGVVGQDFPIASLGFLTERGVDLSGIQKAQGKSFHWQGQYEYDMNVAHTLKTDIGVFADFDPKIPYALRKPHILFLANIEPELQLKVVRSIPRPVIIACDTMNYWIEGRRAALLRTLKEVDILLINEGEVRALAEEVNLKKAAKRIREMGPRRLVVKQGEYGALMFADGVTFSAPGLPLETVVDPTGAGDSFAGGFLGALCKMKRTLFSEDDYRQAVIYGSVMASFNVEQFGCERFKTLEWKDIVARFKVFQGLASFNDSGWA